MSGGGGARRSGRYSAKKSTSGNDVRNGFQLTTRGVSLNNAREAESGSRLTLITNSKRRFGNNAKDRQTRRYHLGLLRTVFFVLLLLPSHSYGGVSGEGRGKSKTSFFFLSASASLCNLIAPRAAALAHAKRRNETYTLLLASILMYRTIAVKATMDIGGSPHISGWGRSPVLRTCRCNNSHSTAEVEWR